MIFIDAGLWIAAFRREDEHFERATELMRQIKEEGETLVSTESVFSEVIGFFARRNSPKAAREAASMILATPRLDFLTASREEFSAAAHAIEKYGLSSYTDALTMAVMESRGIRRLLSFDADFDANKKIRRLS
jgi:predicted nucleic acid-binding protein